MHISIDIETLGTNVDSEIISIGAVAFDMQSTIIDDFYVPIKLTDTGHVNATASTVKFWLSQPAEAYPECFNNNEECTPIVQALELLSVWINRYYVEGVWANGTKFDLGMLEYQYSKHNMTAPWRHNADCCLRTLRLLAKNVNPVNRNVTLHQLACTEANRTVGQGVSHNALYDARWQAFYIAFVYNNLL